MGTAGLWKEIGAGVCSFILNCPDRTLSLYIQRGDCWWMEGKRKHPAVGLRVPAHQSSWF